MTKEEAKNLYLEAVNDLSYPIIKEIVVDMLRYIPEYFYKIPSSSSGKYHPADEICEGGLVLHTLKTLKVADNLAKIYFLSDTDLCLVKAALLLHDTCKSGRTFDMGGTQFEHPLLAAENLLQAFDRVIDKQKYKWVKKIARLIESHMGQWNTNKKYAPGVRLPLPKTKLEKFVHECDYIASRKDFNINL